MKQSIRYVMMFLFCFGVRRIQAIDHGSYTEPSYLDTSVTINDNDRMVGFTVFSGGFEFADSSSVRAIWDCYYPVGGTVELNGGNLVLNQDFFLSPTASFGTSGGTIEGNNYAVDFPAKTGSHDFSGEHTIDSTKFVINASVSLDGEYAFSGDCTIDGNFKVLDLGNSANIIIESGATLTIKNTTIDGVGGDGRILCEDDTGTLILDDVTWVQSGDYQFENGSLVIQNTAKMEGSGVFSYASSKPVTIAEKSNWIFDSGMTFNYASASGDCLAFADKTAVLHLREAALCSAVSGLQLKKGTLIVEGTCPVFSAATKADEGIQLGDGVSLENNITLKIGPESGLDIKTGYLEYNNV